MLLVTVNNMAKNELKVISYAYRDMPLRTYNQLLHDYGGDEADEFRDIIESELIYVGTFGLEDPLREEIPECVQLIRFGSISNDDREESRDQVNVRMISGDHLETCRVVAVKAGIVTEEESFEPGVVMTGDEFREAIGRYHKIWDDIKQDYRIEFTEGRQRFD